MSVSAATIRFRPAPGTHNYKAVFSDTNAVAGSTSATAPLGASTPSMFWAAQIPLSTPMNPNAIASGDFNSDGIPDVVAADARAQTIKVFALQASGVYQQTFVTSGGYSHDAIVIADFNSDGNLDIALPNGSSNTLTILMGHGDGTFTVSTVQGEVAVTALVAADFD